MKPTLMAPVNSNFVLKSINNCNNKRDIPIKTQPSKTLYHDIKTYTLRKKNKIQFNLENVTGFASLNKFNPQDLGLPK